jgi:hypothetical protein
MLLYSPVRTKIAQELSCCQGDIKMSSIVQELTEKKLTSPPKFLPHNIHYETIMGSFAYGVSSDTSDCDVYGFCIPNREIVFPHLAGEIQGFGKQKKRFEQWQEHHVVDKSALGGKGREYDLQIYNIVKYFQLCIGCNPNMIDSLYTDQNCILHITNVGNMVREKRHLFLSKKAWHTFKGYAISQIHKAKTKNDINVRTVRDFEEENSIPHSTTFADIEKEMEKRGSVSFLTDLTDEKFIEYHEMYQAGMNDSKRFQSRKIHDMDVKFLYHVVRLLSEVEQILEEGDIDLREKGRREHMKAIRRGDVSEQDILDWATSKEKQLEEVYSKSKLQHSPNEGKIRQLLLDCLEHHYGSLEKCIVNPDKAVQALREIRDVIDKNADLM